MTFFVVVFFLFGGFLVINFRKCRLKNTRLTAVLTNELYESTYLHPACIIKLFDFVENDGDRIVVDHFATPYRRKPRAKVITCDTDGHHS